MSTESNASTDSLLTSWLESIGMSQYGETFRANGITLDVLPTLTDADLREMGLEVLGHRKLILAAIGDRIAQQPPKPPTTAIPVPFRKLSHFELLEPIGRGGMGTVFRAWDSSLNRQVALKLLDKALAVDDPQFLAGFIREAQSAAAINHPNIVQVYFAGEEQGEYYLVMELLEGQNMADRIERGPMDDKRVLQIARQIVGALAATNARRLIHGDIKPHNIFITKNGDAKLLDFGLAKKTAASTIRESSIVGSAVYLSPERVLSQTEDFRSDIYSLGTTLFEALTGLPPFDAETPYELATKRLNEDAPLLTTVKPTAPVELTRLLARMMAREVKDRPPSYDALLEDIEKAEGSLLAPFDPSRKMALTTTLPTSSQTASSRIPPGRPPERTPGQISVNEDGQASKPAKPGLWKRLSSSKVFLISVAIHVLIGLVATFLVVQTITAKRKLTFKGGPPAPNPSQRVVEHQVQMAKKQQTMSAPTQPRRVTTTNALAKVSLPDMPELPSLGPTIPSKMAGMGGTGMASSVGGMGMAAGNAGGKGLTMFGLRGVNGLVGSFYDLKQERDGKSTEMATRPGEKDGWDGRDEPTNKEYDKALISSIQNGVSEGSMSRYFKGPEPLSTTQIFIPAIPASDGPKAFNLEDKVQPKRWVVIYRGKVTPPESGNYRFIGFCDDILVVRLDGRVVLDGSLFPPTKRSDKKRAYGFPAGDNIELSGGISYRMEIMIGERPGGSFSAFLLLEKKDAQYAGAPKLPIFKLAPSPMPNGGPGLPAVAPDTSWSVWKVQPAQNAGAF